MLKNVKTYRLIFFFFKMKSQTTKPVEENVIIVKPITSNNKCISSPVVTVEKRRSRRRTTETTNDICSLELWLHYFIVRLEFSQITKYLRKPSYSFFFSSSFGFWVLDRRANAPA